MSVLRPTRAEQVRRQIAAVLTLLAVPTSAWAASGLLALSAGRGWSPVRLTHIGLLDHLRLTPPAPGAPVAHAPLLAFDRVPTRTGLWLVTAGALLVVWLLLLARVLLRSASEGDYKDAGADTRRARRLLSPRRVRRDGAWTRADLPWWRRWLPVLRVPLTELGYRIGRARGHRATLWASPELRMKVVARTGWGKTSRLLIDIVRHVPGACLVGTTAADLFERTVRARQHAGHAPRGWRFWTAGFWRPAPLPDRPVWVVDFSDPTHRIADGFPRLTWNPVRGCRDLNVALRRGRAMAYGANDGSRTDANDRFFRDSAGDCLAAWLHAADLSGQGIDALQRWQRNIDDQEAQTIIRRHGAGEPAARDALIKHLDERAAKTTSGVERMLVNATFPLGTKDGQAFTVGGGPPLTDLIATRATIYLLASEDTALTVAPLLTLFADEWVHALRAVALASPGRRLEVWAATILDELRGLTPIPSLPAVAARDRKLGHALVYAVQNDGQLEEVYGDRTAELASSTQLAVYGGYDPTAASEIQARSGQVRIPTVDVGGPLLNPEFDQGGERVARIDARDLQNLGDGESVVMLDGADLFYAYTPSFFQQPLTRRRILAEERSVRAQVEAARARTTAQQRLAWEIADAAYRTGAGA